MYLYRTDSPWAPAEALGDDGSLHVHGACCPTPSFLGSSINTPPCLTSRQESIHTIDSLGHCGCIRASSTQVIFLVMKDC
jgi:hypothetical protein